MSAAAGLLDPEDGPLDSEDDAPTGPSITLRRGEAEQWLDIVFGERAGHVAMAYGIGPYRTAQGAYRHRRWREQQYRWPCERNRLLIEVASLLAEADSGGPMVDVYVCPHLRSNGDHRHAETGMQPGNALPPMWLHADLDGPPADLKLWTALDALRVASGSDGHEHGLVMLTEPCENIDRWYQFQRALRDRLGGGADSKIADNDVLRVPGTVNCKPTAPRAGEPPGDSTPVSLLGWGGRIWTVPELAARLGVDLSQLAPPLRTARPDNSAAAPATVPVPADLTQGIRTAVEGFAAAPNKSDALHSLIGGALFAGYSRDESFALAMAYAMPHIPRYAGREAGEFDRCWSKWVAYQEEHQVATVTVADVQAHLDAGATPEEIRAALVHATVVARDRQRIPALLGGLTVDAAGEATATLTRGPDAFNPTNPVLDPARAAVFAPWVASQVTRHVANTRAGRNERISRDIRRRLGEQAPLAPLWARGRTLGGYSHYAESGLDVDAVAAAIVAAAEEAVTAGRTPDLDGFGPDQMDVMFRAGWAAGQRVPQYPLDEGDPDQTDPDGVHHAVLPPAEVMQRAATTCELRSWDGQSDGDRLVDHFGHELRWLGDAQCWAFYDGTGWNIAGAATQVLNRARRTIDALPRTEALGYKGAPEDGRTVAAADDDSPWAQFLAYVRSRRNQAAHDAMIKQAAGTNRVMILRDAFDPDPWLFNVGNGVLDLRTAALRERDPALLLMLRSTVSYDDLEATCPTWEAFLTEALPDVEVREYLQRVVGYTLTGSVEEHAMLIHHGPALDPRRVFVDVLRAVVGDYSQAVPRGTLVVRKSEGGVPNDFARMVGKRLLVASEPAAGAVLDDEAVTAITDGLPVAARHMRGEWFEFRPVGKLHMFAEHMPVISGGPEAAAKVHVIEWAVRVSRERCRQLLQRILAEELPGVLAWGVRGCLRWQESGLTAPQAVRERTAEHLFHSDVLTQWIDDRIDRTDTEAITETRDLYVSYAARAEQAGEAPLSEKAFSIALVEQHRLRRSQHPRSRRSAFFGVRLWPDPAADAGAQSSRRLRRVR